MNRSTIEKRLSHLKASGTPLHLPTVTLATQLQPIVENFIEKHDIAPADAVFTAIVSHHQADNQLVASLLNSREDDPENRWQQLRERLRHLAQLRYSNLSDAQQDEVVQRALIRVHRYLPNFLYVSSFETWIGVILRNEFHRYWKRVATRATFEGVLNEDSAEKHGRQIDENAPAPETIVQQSQLERALWERLQLLADALDVKLLRGHANGLTLAAMQAQLKPPPPPSLATLSRRLKRAKQRLAEDEAVQQIAADLEII